MLSKEKLTDILDKSYNLLRNSSIGHFTDSREIMSTPVFSALVGYYIAEEEKATSRQQLNG